MMEEPKVRREKTREICPECRSTHVVHDEIRAEVVCGECGLVILDGLEGSSIGSRAQDSPDRGEVSTLRRHDRGLTTDISPASRDHSGTVLEAKRRKQYVRLRKLQYRSRFSKRGEKSLADGLSLLGRTGSRLFLPKSFVSQAAYVYRKAAAAGLIRGRTIAGFVGASLYIASRMHEAPRAIEEVAEALDVPRRQVSLALKVMLRRLKIPLPPSQPESFLARFASELGLSAQVFAFSRQILGEVREVECCKSKTPRGTAAAAIYTAAKILNKKVTQAEISRVARVSEVTIRVRVREIEEEIGQRLRRGGSVHTSVHKPLRDVDAV